MNATDNKVIETVREYGPTSAEFVAHKTGIDVAKVVASLKRNKVARYFNKDCTQGARYFYHV